MTDQTTAPTAPRRFRAYLGDSVYLELLPETEQIVLTTDNGLGPTNRIYLDADTLVAMNREIRRLSQEAIVAMGDRLDTLTPAPE